MSFKFCVPCELLNIFANNKEYMWTKWVLKNWNNKMIELYAYNVKYKYIVSYMGIIVLYLTEI